MISIEIAETISTSHVVETLHRACLESAALKTLQYTSSAHDTSLTILISDDEQLHQLNRQFLGIDEPTDVLSFPAGHIDPDTHTTYLGDVIISYPRAVEQAETAGHPIEEELRLLAVHGALHLLGFDHDEPQDQARMWEAQEEILNRVKRDE